MSATASPNVQVPDIGDFDEVPVIEILVAVGDTVAAEDPLVTLESDKATMDVPAPVAGLVTALKVKIGDRVSEGVELMTIQATNGSDPAAVADEDPAPAAASPPVAPSPSEVPSVTSSAGATRTTGENRPAIYASPSARRLARELGVELAGLGGSGRGGRITRDDVQHASERPAGAGAGAGDHGGAVGGASGF